MASFSTRTTTLVNAKPEDVFGHVSDLTRHGEWSAHPLRVEAVSEGLAAAGSEYRSTSHFMGKDVVGEIRVTHFDSPSRFAFEVSDSTGTHTHDITVQAENGGSLLKHRTSHQVSFIMSLVALLLKPVGKAAMKKFHNRLKEAVEG